MKQESLPIPNFVEIIRQQKCGEMWFVEWRHRPTRKVYQTAAPRSLRRACVRIAAFAEGLSKPPCDLHDEKTRLPQRSHKSILTVAKNERWHAAARIVTEAFSLTPLKPDDIEGARARAEIAVFAATVPDYAKRMRDLREMFSTKPREFCRTVSTQTSGHPHCEDDAWIDFAAATLGLNSPTLPSAKYGSNCATSR